MSLYKLIAKTGEAADLPKCALSTSADINYPERTSPKRHQNITQTPKNVNANLNKR